MSGTLRIVGLGPGDAGWITPEVTRVLAAATDLIGYAPYLARLRARTRRRTAATTGWNSTARGWR